MGTRNLVKGVGFCWAEINRPCSDSPKIMLQHYLTWELIVICESTEALAVRDLCEMLGLSDRQRLRLVEVECGNHENLMTGVAASSGEFVWFVKCGDLLARDALGSIVQVLNERPDTDLFYCDEDQALSDGTRPVPFFKPSWSPELLLSTNYLSYSSVFRRAVLWDIIESNGECRELTLYDCLLWMAEKSHKIIHLSSVLYHSRGRSDSRVAGSAMPAENISAGKPALERALLRREIEGTVEETALGNVPRTVPARPTTARVDPYPYQGSRVPVVTMHHQHCETHDLWALRNHHSRQWEYFSGCQNIF